MLVALATVSEYLLCNESKFRQDQEPDCIFYLFYVEAKKVSINFALFV